MVFNTKRVYVAIICAVFILGFASQVTAGKILIRIDGRTGDAVVKKITGASTVEELPGDIACAESIWFFKTFDEGGLKCHNVPFGTEGKYKKISFDPDPAGGKRQIKVRVDTLTGEARIVQIKNAETIELIEEPALICEESDFKIKRHPDLTCVCYSIPIAPGWILFMCFGDTCP